ncbi:MAG: DUF1844 domain-containing protein [Terriglobales bacterium]|jgi:hypothetical protein
MAEKKQEEFKVSDRRLFTADGELRSSSDEQETATAERTTTERTTTAGPVSAGIVSDGLVSDAPVPSAPTPVSPARAGQGADTAVAAQVDEPASAVQSETDAPPPPTASEQKAQHDAYRESSRDLDRRVELSGHSSKELEVTFERFMASLYMTAMMQLGLMQEQGGQPGVDLIGARQTIDTLGMIAEKTKGNLTPKEQGFLQNCLYELRMAYVEVTNALARAPQAPGAVTGTNG